jgi:endoglucanase
MCLGAVLFATASAGARSPGSPKPRAAGYHQQCRDPYSATRDPANPLALPTPPGANPLVGANFFVDGPAHGAAAGAIAQLVGISPASQPDGESWAAFSAGVQAKIAGNGTLGYDVAELSKIAAEPEAQRISAYSRGGHRGAVFLQTEKIICKNLAADPGSIPILNTYFLHPAAGLCPLPRALKKAAPLFERRVDEFVDAVARRPALLLLETDAIGNSSCIAHDGSLPEWEALLRYEIEKVAALPHAVAYVEAGYSDSKSVAYTANVLNAIGVRSIRGFYTNDTHLNWTINEVNWATQVSQRTGGVHFIVNTAQNGQGPLLNQHPSKQGVEDLCNPPGRGLGPRPTTDTGFPLADAWMWTSPPGNSSGCGGGPKGGVFWTARAIGLAAAANSRLGPTYPSQPY